MHLLYIIPIYTSCLRIKKRLNELKPDSLPENSYLWSIYPGMSAIRITHIPHFVRRDKF